MNTENNAAAAEKLDMFRDVIARQTDEEINDLCNKARAQRAASGKGRQDAAAKEALDEVRAKCDALTAKHRRELSRCDFETNRAILSHRNELIADFFSEIEADIERFVSSESYDDYLKGAIERAAALLGGGIVIYAAGRDAERVRSLTSLEVRTDVTIRLGGISAADEEKGLFADLTLDRALADERDAFSDKSELRL